VRLITDRTVGYGGGVTAFETLCLTTAGDRLVVDLHRPRHRNAINAAMVAELHQVCSDLAGINRAVSDRIAERIVDKIAVLSEAEKLVGPGAVLARHEGAS
jgi:hypothetical protein